MVTRSTGGTAPTDASSPYLAGATVTVLGNTGSLVKSGYTFTGWNTAANGSGTTYNAGNTFTMAGNTTLYALWALNHTVTFNGNGSTGGSMSNQTAGVPTALTTNTFTRTGYSFCGWNTAANGSGTAYADGASYSFAADLTLYAQWRGTVTYNGNTNTGGTVPTDASSPYLAGATVTVLGNTGSLAKSGYTFTGWNTAANGSGTTYTAGNTFTMAGNTTLYALWAQNHTVTFNGNGSTGGATPAQTNYTTANLTLNGFTRTNFSFSGWNTAANGSGTAYADGASYSFAADLTLYAQWRGTVTYNGNTQHQWHPPNGCFEPLSGWCDRDGTGEHRLAGEDRLHLHRLEHGRQRFGHHLHRRKHLHDGRQHHPVCAVGSKPHRHLQWQRQHRRFNEQPDCRHSYGIDAQLLHTEWV